MMNNKQKKDYLKYLRGLDPYNLEAELVAAQRDEDVESVNLIFLVREELTRKIGLK